MEEAQLIKAIAEQRRRQQQSGTKRGGTGIAGHGNSAGLSVGAREAGGTHTTGLSTSLLPPVVSALQSPTPPRSVPDGAEGLSAVSISRLCPARAEPPGT